MLYAAAFGRLVFECTKTKGSGDVECEGEWHRKLQAGRKLRRP